MAEATPEQVFDSLPSDYMVNDKALFVRAYGKLQRCLSRDGVLTEAAVRTVHDVLAAFDPAIAAARIDLGATYDNSFVEKATAR